MEIPVKKYFATTLAMTYLASTPQIKGMIIDLCNLYCFLY